MCARDSLRRQSFGRFGRKMGLELLLALKRGLPLDPLPVHPGRDASVPHAPKRAPTLSKGRCWRAHGCAMRQARVAER